MASFDSFPISPASAPVSPVRGSSLPVDRRTFLRAGAAGTLGLLGSARGLWAADFRVGVGHEANGYAAAQRAIAFAGTWPGNQIAGRRVIVKPNLVAGLPSATGVTTDPEVTRAVVDLALQSGAAEVVLVETAANGANFEACGYGFFPSYDPRVRLVDLKNEALTLAAVPGGLAYKAILTPQLVVDPEAIYITVAKLKTHGETVATLSIKNQFGLPAVDRYISRPSTGRFAMHDRGIPQAVVDMNLLRPPHFAVIDGVVGLEGLGPVFGSPVTMNLVFAGSNAVAVDRVALNTMEIEPVLVRHLVLASRAGLGPADLSNITVVGDPITTRPFALPAVAPILEYPRVFPAVFSPAQGDSIGIRTWYLDTVVREIDVLELSDDSPDVRLVRNIAPLAGRWPGNETVSWDGRSDDGLLVPPGRYAVHVRAFNPRARTRHADGVGWVTVI